MDLNKPITQEQFGELVGVSGPAISKQVSAGVLERGATLKVWLIAYCDNLRRRAAGHIAAGNGLDLVQERAALANVQRQQTELKNAEIRGELVRARDVRREIYIASRQIRNTMLTLPDRIASKLVTVDDGLIIHEMLEAEVTVMLEDVAALGDQMQENQQEEGVGLE